MTASKTPRRSRSDAVRNRAAILTAADQLFDTEGSVADITVQQVADAARVGKGTVFRAFGDQQTLIRAVFDLRFQSVQQRILVGGPPLGPGTDPRRRLHAILDAVLEFKLHNRSLAGALEIKANSPFTGPHYEPLHTVIAGELRATGCESASYMAHVLLGAVRSDLIEHMVQVAGFTEKQLFRHLRHLIDAHVDNP